MRPRPAARRPKGPFRKIFAPPAAGRRSPPLAGSRGRSASSAVLGAECLVLGARRFLAVVIVRIGRGSFDRIYRIDRIGREGEESGFAVENIENVEKRGGRLSAVGCRLSFFFSF